MASAADDTSLVVASTKPQKSKVEREVYRVISHSQIYSKYENDYEGRFTMTDKGFALYASKHFEIHNEKDIYVSKLLDEFEHGYDTENEDYIIDDPILIDVVMELGSNQAFKYSKCRRDSQREFHLWTLDAKYKGYCRIKVWSDGSRSLEVDYDRYKMDEIRRIVKEENTPSDIVMRITDLLSERDERPKNEWV